MYIFSATLNDFCVIAAGFGEDCFDQPPNCLPLLNPELMNNHEQTKMLILPTTSSECSLDGEMFHRDALLSSHPLLPHLQEVLEGKKDHPFFLNPNLASGLTCGISGADETLLQAVAQAVDLCRDTETCALVRRIDQECSKFAGDTQAFCQKLFTDMQVGTPSVSTANQANENVNVVNISYKEYHCNELQESMDDTYLDRQTHKPLPNPLFKRNLLHGGRGNAPSFPKRAPRF